MKYGSNENSSTNIGMLLRTKEPHLGNCLIINRSVEGCHNSLQCPGDNCACLSTTDAAKRGSRNIAFCQDRLWTVSVIINQDFYECEFYLLYLFSFLIWGLGGFRFPTRKVAMAETWFDAAYVPPSVMKNVWAYLRTMESVYGHAPVVVTWPVMWND